MGQCYRICWDMCQKEHLQAISMEGTVPLLLETVEGVGGYSLGKFGGSMCSLPDL